MNALLANLTDFGVDARRGFLPDPDPLNRLESAFDAWEDAARELPKLLMTDGLRTAVEGLPPLDPNRLRTPAQLERAMMLLSYLGHAYVWGGRDIPKSIPACIAVPWHSVAQRLERPPVLSYPSYALHNWRRIDPNGPIALGNIALLQNFWGGADEEWFVLVHVDIENQAAPALAKLFDIQSAAQQQNLDDVGDGLRVVGDALEQMLRVMRRMPEFCDPYIYFRRVRPYIFGWKDQPALPDGLIYEGVDAYGGAPQKFRGETGAQSGIIPAFDAVLGITHADDPLRTFLVEMRQYMSAPHRNFVDALEANGNVRDVVLGGGSDIVDAYDRCVEHIRAFRAIHLEYAATYIQRQASGESSNPTEIGTGGTPFMRYLKKHRDETAEHSIEGQQGAQRR